MAPPSERGGDLVQRSLQGETPVGAEQRASRVLQYQPRKRQTLHTKRALGFQERDKREQATTAAQDRRGVQARQRVRDGVLGSLQDDDQSAREFPALRWSAQLPAAGTGGPAVASPRVSFGLDPHRAVELAADRMLALVEPYEHRSTERLAIHDLKASVERDALRGEVAQHLRV